MILSTHIVSDVEAVATEIAVINEGRLLVHTSPEALLGSVVGKVWRRVIASADLAAARQDHVISGLARRSDGVHVRLVSAAPPSSDAQAVPPTLEDGYLYRISQAGRRGLP